LIDVTGDGCIGAAQNQIGKYKLIEKAGASARVADADDEIIGAL
jgi:hypothetical protein